VKVEPFFLQKLYIGSTISPYRDNTVRRITDGQLKVLDHDWTL